MKLIFQQHGVLPASPTLPHRVGRFESNRDESSRSLRILKRLSNASLHKRIHIFSQTRAISRSTKKLRRVTSATWDQVLLVCKPDSFGCFTVNPHRELQNWGITWVSVSSWKCCSWAADDPLPSEASLGTLPEFRAGLSIQDFPGNTLTPWFGCSDTWWAAKIISLVRQNGGRDRTSGLGIVRRRMTTASAGPSFGLSDYMLAALHVYRQRERCTMFYWLLSFCHSNTASRAVLQVFQKPAFSHLHLRISDTGSRSSEITGNQFSKVHVHPTPVVKFPVSFSYVWRDIGRFLQPRFFL